MIGTTLGHFEVLEKLGAGGMGEVYRAHDSNLDRDVALKVLPAGTVDEGTRRQLRKEALALAKLKHANIGVIHDFRSENGVDFLVMELIEGADLASKVKQGPIPEEEVVQFGIQIAQALEEAHEHNIVHRDLKPQNVMVTAKHQAKVLDFGLAKLVRPVTDTTTASMTEVQAIAGTLPYMAPEQLQGGDIDARTDVYALGVTLYEIATGRRPFVQTDGAQLIKAILHDHPASPREINASTSEDLSRVTLKAIRKKPSERYQTATELREDLERLQAGFSVAAPRPAPRWLTRQSVGAGGAIVATIAILLGLNVLGLRDRLTGNGPGVRIVSLAVLPLANFSGDPDQEYVADGMTESLITKLQRLGGLEKVSARQSTKRFKDTDLSIASIAEQLGVQAILEGSVMRAGNSVRVTAKLIDVTTERSIWADEYQVPYGDLLTLENTMTRAIAQAIDMPLSNDEEIRLSDKRVDPEAMELYQRGLVLLSKKSTPTMLVNAVDHFERAVKVDSSFALAFVALSEALWWHSYGYGDDERETSRDELYSRAKQAAAQALDLDPRLAEAHAFAGKFHMHEKEYEAAELEYKRALQLNPNSAIAHKYYAEFLARVGRLEEAVTTMERAHELDPVTVSTITELGWVYEATQQYDRAIVQFKKALQLEPNDSLARYNLGCQYIAKEMFEAAIPELERAMELSGRESIVGGKGCVSWLAYAYGKIGQKERARELLEELKAGPFSQPSLWLAQAHMSVDEHEEALDVLEAAFDEGLIDSVERVGAEHWPSLAPLRSHPRFVALDKRAREQQD